MPIGGTSVGNIVNMVRQAVSVDFANSRSHQGVAIFPELILDALSQANLTDANARIYLRTAAPATGTLTIESNAARLFGFVADNTEAAANYLVFYDLAAPTIGTTEPDAMLLIPASRMVALVIPGGWVFDTAFVWTALDGADFTGTTLAGADTIRLMAVYAE